MKLSKITGHKYFFPLCVFALLLIATLLRTYHFTGHVAGFGSDANRDVMIAREALNRHQLPLFGTFSSAGSFVIGPTFFWLIMLSFLVFPFSFYAPWVMVTIFSIITIGAFIGIGFLIGGRRLAIITGLLSAFSPQLIGRASYLTNPSMVAPAATLALLCYVLTWKKQRSIYAFLLGLAIGFAISFHYQALNLLILLPALLFIPKTKWVKKIFWIFLALLGATIALSPLLLWDMQQGFANTNNLLDYMLIAQYRLYVPNSWRIFLIQVLPINYANIIGGNVAMSIPIIILTSIYFIFAQLKTRKLTVITIIGGMLFLLLLLNRYYKGERSDGYMIYFIPFIITLVSWTIYDLFFKKNNKIYIALGIFIVTLIISMNFYSAKQFILYKTNENTLIAQTANTLTKKFPGHTFMIYDNKSETTNVSYAVANYLASKNLTNEKGIKIGFTRSHPHKTVRIGEINHVYLIDLSKNNDINKNKLWRPATQSALYDELITFWTKHKINATFSLPKYLQERILRQQ